MSIEAFRSADLGLWYLRDTETGHQVPDRGPYVEHKTANRAARRLNGVEHTQPAEPAPSEPQLPEAEREEEAEEIEVVILPTSDPAAQDPQPNASSGRTSALRHAWLEDAADWAASRLISLGLDVPEQVRVTIGWPLGSRGGKGHSIGQCWHAEASRDGHREVFVSPELDDGARVVDVLLHELIHASLPPKAKHGAAFKKWATLAGLEGKMTATTAGPELTADIAEFIAVRGPFPTAGIDKHAEGRPKQTTRLIKAECCACGYTVRLSRKWLDVAYPVCPDPDCIENGAPMMVEGE